MNPKIAERAWKLIMERPPAHMPDRRGIFRSGRPENYVELEYQMGVGARWEYAFPSFLDEFYLHRDARFFAEPPSNYFPQQRRVFLAAVAEYLCHRFNLPVPAWVSEPEFNTPFKIRVDLGGGPAETREQRWTETPLEFASRNMIYDPSGLIRL